MCCGLFGVQIVWGLQNVNTSRIFQTLGAEPRRAADPVDRGADHRPAGPADRSAISATAPGGRSAAAAPICSAARWSARSALVLMPNVLEPVGGERDAVAADRRDQRRDGAVPRAGRRLVPEEQRTAAFADAGRLHRRRRGARLGPAMAGRALGAASPTRRRRGGCRPRSRIAFYIGAVGLLATRRAHRRHHAPSRRRSASPAPPARTAAPAAKAGRGRAPRAAAAPGSPARFVIALVTALGGYRRELYLIAGVAALLGVGPMAAARGARVAASGRPACSRSSTTSSHMPAVLRRLAVVQFFTWFGLFAMWIYAVPAIAARERRRRRSGQRRL